MGKIFTTVAMMDRACYTGEERERARKIRVRVRKYEARDLTFICFISGTVAPLPIVTAMVRHPSCLAAVILLK